MTSAKDGPRSLHGERRAVCFFVVGGYAPRGGSFGAAAGVGKTYARLEAAREQRQQGVDVVVGWVETHGRADTEALLLDASGDRIDRRLPADPVPGAARRRDVPRRHGSR